LSDFEPEGKFKELEVFEKGIFVYALIEKPDISIGGGLREN
jgi:hypothetical protein